MKEQKSQIVETACPRNRLNERRRGREGPISMKLHGSTTPTQMYQWVPSDFNFEPPSLIRIFRLGR